MADRLDKLGIETVEDLINYYPFRYQNYALISPLNKLQEGEIVTVRGVIENIDNQYLRGAKTIQKAVLTDESGEIEVSWFNQPFLTQALKKGTRVALSGKVKNYRGKISLASPEYEIIENQAVSFQKTIHTGRLVPVYPETRGISSKYLRKIIASLLPRIKEKIPEILPVKTIIKYQLLARKEALAKIHFPENKLAAAKARERLAFEEMFFYQLKILKKKQARQKEKKAFVWKIKKSELNKKVKEFIDKLPFKLTGCQKRAVKEILTDMKKPQPMNRLFQGDVGSGKTIVAAIAALASLANGYSVAFMVPTEILAFQHYQTLKKFFTPLKIPVELITGSKKIISRKKVKIILGTHALLFKKKPFSNLGLIIIDEQHRFGVAQRKKLLKQISSGFLPHRLTMTATPIPRTIALTLYGDLEISILDKMPPGRKPVSTFVIPSSKRKKCYHWLKKEVKKKKIQAFIICPLIEPSETLTTVKAAKEEFSYLKKKVFSNLKLALLHGRLPGKKKNQLLEKMQKRKIDILVATPVVEVGLDLPWATVMIIEEADRFGLAQLHQLRGRVGRREEKSYCFLFAQKAGPKAIKRLKALTEIHQGLKLAELDLQWRGPGESYGLKQHGFPKFKIADIGDLDLILKTRQVAAQNCAKIRE